MTGPNRYAAVLAAALLLAQALAVAHAFDHPLVGQADHVCAICLHGAGWDDDALPATGVPAPTPTAVNYPNFLLVQDRSAPVPVYRSRAPPILR